MIYEMFARLLIVLLRKKIISVTELFEIIGEENKMRLKVKAIIEQNGWK